MIDIVMATYNGGKYLQEQIESILNQSYKDIHLIIRDDGSTDDTVAIIQEYVRKYPRVIQFVQDNINCGSSKSNFMQALKYSTSEYVMFSDQDDVWLSEKIKHTYDKMIEIENSVGNSIPILVFASYKPVDEELNDIKDKKGNRQEAAYKLSFSNLLVQNYVNGCLMMVNRSLADLMGDYDDAILMHDWWAALLASGAGAIEHIDDVLMLYRQHEGNVVGSVNVKSAKYRFMKLLDPKTKSAHKMYLKQALLLKERNMNNLQPESKKQLDEFVSLFSKKKLGRVRMLIKGKYLKSDLIRILGQIFYV